MSKLITLAAVAASAIIPMAANADEYTDSYGQTWSYTVGDDGKSVTLTGIADKTLSYDAANFPWTFLKDGTWYTITNVAANACRDWSTLSGTLSIPGTVKSIGGTEFESNHDGAFYGCSGLNGLSISEGVETIGCGAFSFALNNKNGGSGSLIVPSSVKSLGHDFLYYGGLAVKAAWFKGKPTATSGVQQYSVISPYRTILHSPCDGMTVLFGPNTKLSYSDKVFFHRNAKGCTVFLPENGQHAAKWDFGSNTKVVKYGAGKELDLDIDEAAGKITATVKTTDALSAVLNSAANFKTYFGLDTRIEVTSALDIAAGTITAAQLQYATFNSLMLAVKTQDQLNSILGVIPASVPVSIDPTGATQNLKVSTADGRKVYVLLPENGTYKLRPDGLVISFH